uniref:EGF-like domain-containing protein n=1 Tax=Romanomermis culicivorax TaxID=13658 RepID=A0A915HMF3_ROMCU
MKNVVRPPVFPPYLLAQFVNLLPTVTMAFLGGVSKSGITRPKRQVVIQAGAYSSSLPSLMGSLRGFKIGDKSVNLRHFVQDSDNRLIFNGSYFRCDELDCHNNGKCVVDWAANNHRGRPTLSCDCSQTSYNGEKCDEDNGVLLDGRTFLSFSLPEARIDANLLQPYDVVALAFAVSPPSKFGDKELNEQRLNSDVDWNENDGVLLASLSFSANFRIVMRSVHNRTHSCIRITMNTSPAEKLEFFGNFFDQRRHMVYMRFLNQEAQILFRIDQQQSIERNMPEYFSFSRLDRLNIGGGLGVHEINFQGTISTGSYVKFMGSTYPVGGKRFILLWENHPLDPPIPFTLVECPKFDAQNGNFKMVSDNMENMMPSIQQPPFEILPFEEDDAAVSSMTEPEETPSSNSGLVIGLILGAITVIILLTMVLACKFSGRRGRPTARHVNADDNRKSGFTPYEPEETNSNEESRVEKTESVVPSQDYSPANAKLAQNQQQDTTTTSFSDTKKRSASVV